MEEKYTRKQKIQHFWLSDPEKEFAVGKWGLLGEHWHMLAMFLGFI